MIIIFSTLSLINTSVSVNTGAAVRVFGSQQKKGSSFKPEVPK